MLYQLLKYGHNNPYFKFPNENEFTLVKIKNLSDEEEFSIGKFLMDQRKKEYDYMGATTFFVPGGFVVNLWLQAYSILIG